MIANKKNSKILFLNQVDYFASNLIQVLIQRYFMWNNKNI